MSYAAPARRPHGPRQSRQFWPALATIRALIAAGCAATVVASLVSMHSGGAKAWPGLGAPDWAHLRYHSDLWWLVPTAVIYLIGAFYARRYEARWWHTVRGLAVCLSLMMGVQGIIIALKTPLVPRRFFALGDFSLLANGRWAPELTVALAVLIIFGTTAEWALARTGQGLLTWPVIIPWALILIGFFTLQLVDYEQSGAMRIYRIVIWVQADYFWRILAPMAPVLLIIAILTWALAVLAHPDHRTAQH